jgi:hypothetical protein
LLKETEDVFDNEPDLLTSDKRANSKRRAKRKESKALKKEKKEFHVYLDPAEIQNKITQ